MLARLRPDVLRSRPSIPSSRNKAPGPGKDILLASANNLYSGVSSKEADAFKKAGREKHGLNSRLVKQNGQLVEEVYKVGGRYSKEITAIVTHLEAAIPFATRADGQRAARAGAVVPHRRGRRPREVRHRLGGGQVVAGGHDQRVHRGLPGRARHQGRLGRRGVLRRTARRPSASASSPTTRSGSRTTCRTTPSTASRSVKGIVANAIDVVVETGDSGPVTPVGINLPNDQTDPRAVRQQVRARSATSARPTTSPRRGSMRGEFAWTPEEAERSDEVRRRSPASCTPTCTR